MAKFQRFEDIEAWQRARELTGNVYRITGCGPFGRDFGLRDQIRRACVSVMSNIAEGFERDGDREFRQFLSLAKASVAEVRSQLYVAMDAGYLTETEFEAMRSRCEEISRMLTGLMRYLQTSTLNGPKFRNNSDQRGCG